MTRLHRPGVLWPALAIAFLQELEIGGRRTATRTLKLTDEAVLAMDADGTCHVVFRGASYRRDDIVPPEIFHGAFPFAWPDRPYLLPKTAGDFVSLCMAQTHDHTHEWPEIAQQLLWPVVRLQSANARR